MIAAKSLNGVIGRGEDIPWQAKGEQLLFKALTHQQWLLVGRKTFESMGLLANRNFVVISRTKNIPSHDRVLVYPDLEQALAEMKNRTNLLFVAGGGQLYQQMIDRADQLIVSTIRDEVVGDIYFPSIGPEFKRVYQQFFPSNIDYDFEIWQRQNELTGA